MTYWSRRERSRTGGLEQKTTDQGGGSEASDGDKPPQMKKAMTEYPIYRPSELLPVYISAYNLDWGELVPYLKILFPKQALPENQMGIEDNYLIYVPRRLVQEEHDEIERIRKAHRERVTHGGQGRPRRVEHSPDGPRQQDTS